MNILIVYDSYFGNTTEVAKSIFNRLREKHNVAISHVLNSNLKKSLQPYNCVIIGSPTRYGDTTKNIKKFIKYKGINSDKKYFLFDTRMKENHFFKNPLHKYYMKKNYGSSSIEKMLSRKKINIEASIGLYVRDSDGPMERYEDKLDDWINREINNIHNYSISLKDLTKYNLKGLKLADRYNSEYHNIYKPYLPKKSELEYKINYRKLLKDISDGRSTKWNSRKLIVNSLKDDILGYVSYYWRSLDSLWLEVEVVIFNKEHWRKGIGYEALSKWISQLFLNNIDLLRVGISTWSGNTGMIRLADKLNFKTEACYKNVLKVNNKMFDFRSYVLSRETWLEGKL